MQNGLRLWKVEYLRIDITKKLQERKNHQKMVKCFKVIKAKARLYKLRAE